MKTLVVLLLLASTAAADDLVPAKLPAKICDAVREEPPPPAYVFVKQVEEPKPPPTIPVRVSTTSIRIAMTF